MKAASGGKAGDLRQALDWGRLAPLRVKARRVADGVYAGVHRSSRRGTGVEFGGHRNYVPGDDLRWLDRHALMRHGRLVIREFETETDRALRLVVDATASMAYRSQAAPGAKLAYAAVVGAALARIALAGGDPVALGWIGGRDCRALPVTGGREAFDRLVGALQDAAPGGDLGADARSIDRALGPVAQYARRGTVVVVLTDLLDLPPGSPQRLCALATRGRTVVVVRILDPAEARFSFEGPVRLRASEGNLTVETDAGAAREGYLAALAQVVESVADQLVPRGGHVVCAETTDDPVDVVRRILGAVGGYAW
jgi:uncharacterized protein (DUF58 family)